MAKLALLLIICIAYLNLSCGDDDYDNDPPTAPDDSYVTVKPLVDKNCGGCHTAARGLPVFDTAAKLKAGKAKVRIANGTMPPAPAYLSADDKKALLDYLQ